MSGHLLPEDDDPWAEYIRQQIEMVQQREDARRAQAAQRRSRRRQGAQPAGGPAPVANLDALVPLADRSVLSAELLKLGPNVISGSGGSGTRVVARIARRGGMFIGSDLNEFEDELTHFWFEESWLDHYLLAQARGRSKGVLRTMGREFEAHVSNLCAPLGNEPRPWGWKTPRSLLLLPFLHTQFPLMKFVHLIRDGRYMAYSKQQYTLRRHQFVLLDPVEQSWTQPAQAIALWRRTNLEAADYGEQRMGDRYLRVRFEDLCANPIPVVQRILDFLGLAKDAAEIARLEVQPPPATRPWESDDQETVAKLEAIGRDALERFGYRVDP